MCEQGTIASFSLVGRCRRRGDYMLIEMPETEAAPAEVVPEFDVDPNLTKQTLDNQLAEMIFAISANWLSRVCFVRLGSTSNSGTTSLFWMTRRLPPSLLAQIASVVRPIFKPPKVHWSQVAATDFLLPVVFSHLNPFLDSSLPELITPAGWVDKMRDTTTVFWGF